MQIVSYSPEREYCLPNTGKAVICSPADNREYCLPDNNAKTPYSPDREYCLPNNTTANRLVEILSLGGNRLNLLRYQNYEKFSLKGMLQRQIHIGLTVLAATFNSSLQIVNSSRLIVQNFECLVNAFTKLIRVKMLSKNERENMVRQDKVHARID